MANGLSRTSAGTSLLQGAIGGFREGRQIKRENLQADAFQKQQARVARADQSSTDASFYAALAPVMDASIGGGFGDVPIEGFFDDFKQTTEGKDAQSAVWTPDGNLEVQYPSGKTLIITPEIAQFKARLGGTRGRRKGGLTESQKFSQGRAIRSDFDDAHDRLIDALTPERIKTSIKGVPQISEIAPRMADVRREFKRAIKVAPDEQSRTQLIQTTTDQIDEQIANLQAELSETTTAAQTARKGFGFIEKRLPLPRGAQLGAGISKEENDAIETVRQDIKELQTLRKEIQAAGTRAPTPSKKTKGTKKTDSLGIL